MLIMRMKNYRQPDCTTVRVWMIENASLYTVEVASIKDRFAERDEVHDIVGQTFMSAVDATMWFDQLVEALDKLYMGVDNEA